VATSSSETKIFTISTKCVIHLDLKKVATYSETFIILTISRQNNTLKIPQRTFYVMLRQQVCNNLAVSLYLKKNLKSAWQQILHPTPQNAVLPYPCFASVQSISRRSSSATSVTVMRAWWLRIETTDSPLSSPFPNQHRFKLKTNYNYLDIALAYKLLYVLGLTKPIEEILSKATKQVQPRQHRTTAG
jgi:hypothetical protein